MRIRRAIWTLPLVWCLLLFNACSVHVDGGTSLSLVAERGAPSLTGDTLHTALGYRVRFERLYLAIQAVQLIPASGLADARPAWRRASDLLLPTDAYAHTPGTPTRLGVPSVLALNAAPGTRWALGDLAPPPGTYRGIRVILAPPDDDAQYLPSDVDMIDHALHVDGMAFRGVDSVAISLAIPIHDSVEVSVATGGTSLPLQARSRYRLRMAWDPGAWFDSVDFFHDAPSAWQDSIRVAIHRGLSLTLEAGRPGAPVPTAP